MSAPNTVSAPNTEPPLLAEAYRLLRMDLNERLDAVDFLAEQNGDWDDGDIALARAVIPDLVNLVWTILHQHGYGPDGSCTQCGDRWPCQVVQTVHADLHDPQHHFLRLRDHAWTASGC